jgi:hypothetical protein
VVGFCEHGNTSKHTGCFIGLDGNFLIILVPIRFSIVILLHEVTFAVVRQRKRKVKISVR